MRRARLFVGHDSGPMHLASVVGIPCVAMFGDFNPPKNGTRSGGASAHSRHARRRQHLPQGSVSGNSISVITDRDASATSEQEYTQSAA